MDTTSDSSSNLCNGTHQNQDDHVNNNAGHNNVNISSRQRERTPVSDRINSSVNNRMPERVSVERAGSRGNNVSRSEQSGVSADSENASDECNGGGRTVTTSVDIDPRYEVSDNDKEIEELSKLRCQSVATEVVAERYKRRCSDYPGLAFGRSIFSSNTMMKFSVIKNELHNIMNVQLRRVSIFMNITE